MAESAFFFSGLRLKDAAHGWRPRSDRSGEYRLQGVTQKFGTINPASPNFFETVQVVTDIRPVTARADLDNRTTLAVDLSALQTSLRDKGDDQTHPLCWVRTVARRASVTGGPHSGTHDVPITAWDDGWSAVAGRYVLVRKKSTGAGFVSEILSIPAANQIRIHCHSPIDSTWEVLETQIHYPAMLYVSMDAGTWPQDDPASDGFRTMVTYEFEGVAAPIYSPAYAPTPE